MKEGETMTGKQRVNNIFLRKSVDRLPVGEDFWGDVLKKWREQGHLSKNESPVSHFQLDLDRAGLLNWYLDPEFKNKILDENEDTVVILNGNGVKLRQQKDHDSTPGYVSYFIKDRDSWEEHGKPHLLKVNRKRISFTDYRLKRLQAKKAGRYFSNDSFGPFELMQRLCGHVKILEAMVLDPEWIKDMVMTFIDFNINHFEVLFAREGLPDSTWIAEDLGFKFKPFFSPEMFKDMFQPGYEKLFSYLHSKGLKVIMHSCGYIEPLLPALIEVGLDCLEAMEVKAGMDIIDLYEKYGDDLVFFGNVDIRALESNDFKLIDEELSKIKRVVKNGGRYILHSDHSISPRVKYETYRYFLDQARKI